MTQRELADACAIHSQSISDIERGATKNPRPEHLFKIADKLKVNPRWLVFGKGPSEPVTLTAKESELLEVYRTLDATGRAQLLSYGHGRQADSTRPPEGDLPTPPVTH